jgi:ADP-heptose:LPS heptosyltransferase
MRTLKKLKIKKVYDLQNSSRTKFYKNILFPKANFNTWSSSETTLPSNTLKEEFDKNPVLDRFDHQLKTSGIKTKHTMKPNFSWAVTNTDNIKQEFKLDKYIVLFPFCSAHLTNKKWPYYNELIELIKNKYGDQIKVVVAPGPSEVDGAKNINAVSILDKGKALDISQLANLIKESSFVIANDTGPAHMTAHLGVKGLTLFGKHTTAYKVSIERENFKAIQVDDLEKLSASKVLEKILI